MLGGRLFEARHPHVLGCREDAHRDETIEIVLRERVARKTETCFDERCDAIAMRNHEAASSEATAGSSTIAEALSTERSAPSELASAATTPSLAPRRSVGN